jgi:hypothetical protein
VIFVEYSCAQGGGVQLHNQMARRRFACDESGAPISFADGSPIDLNHVAWGENWNEVRAMVNARHRDCRGDCSTPPPEFGDRE